MESYYPPLKHARGPQETKYHLAPSLVVSFFNLRPEVVDSDLLDAIFSFGRISYIVNLAAQKSMALVEFEQIESASKCVEVANRTGISVAGHPVKVQYSTSPVIRRHPSESVMPSKVLSLSISNIKYPIGLDVIHQICSPHAKVELENEEAAKNVKRALNGADIYEGCCTLRVEFASVDHLRVANNDEDHWDVEKAMDAVHRANMIAPSQQSGLPASTFFSPVDGYNSQHFQLHSSVGQMNLFAKELGGEYDVPKRLEQSHHLLESAEMIQKLSSISQELAREKYAAVQMRIAHKYDEIEQLLIEEFIKSHDRKRLKEIANILSEFKGFSQCLDAFVERVQNSAFRSGNVFEDILALCEKTNPMLAEIFPNPSQVMAKLILNVFHGKLQETVGAKLQETQGDPESYLVSLHDLYSKTLKLQAKLQKFKSDSDPQFLPTLVRSVFGPYLVTYSKIEKKFIYDQCTAILNRFYDSKGHQKRNIHAGGLQDLKRDIQARLLTVENFGNETFLSEEVAINILQEAKNAFGRCSVLCKKSESIEMTEYLYDVLLKFLYTNHVEYAIELALAGISLAEQKTEPSTNFFGVIQQSSAITHLFVKLFDDTIHPLVNDTPIEEAVQKDAWKDCLMPSWAMPEDEMNHDISVMSHDQP
uniref:Exocyst complex component 5 n=1 Tax=Ditylenchus dipsaci TaxID=166011 RepID=A0A915DYX2_9BILA